MASPRSIIARDDTLLGVCFALGQDFGFNPLYLRILLALGLFWSLTAALAAYAALGAVVALSRWIAPDVLPAAPAEEAVAPDEDDACAELPLAA